MWGMTIAQVRGLQLVSMIHRVSGLPFAPSQPIVSKELLVQRGTGLGGSGYSLLGLNVSLSWDQSEVLVIGC